MVSFSDANDNVWCDSVSDAASDVTSPASSSQFAQTFDISDNQNDSVPVSPHAVQSFDMTADDEKNRLLYSS